jgi:hypothetical protein
MVTSQEELWALPQPIQEITTAQATVSKVAAARISSLSFVNWAGTPHPQTPHSSKTRLGKFMKVQGNVCTVSHGMGDKPSAVYSIHPNQIGKTVLHHTSKQ